jgi:hypothetical protein
VLGKHYTNGMTAATESARQSTLSIKQKSRCKHAAPPVYPYTDSATDLAAVMDREKELEQCFLHRRSVTEPSLGTRRKSQMCKQASRRSVIHKLVSVQHI